MRLPVFRAQDTRSRPVRLGHLIRQTRALARLPATVRSFYIRALWLAWRHQDQYSFDVVARPVDLAQVLRLAEGADVVVELGTATAWTAIALALARQSRRVTTYDPVERPQRELYLGLVAAPVRERIAFVSDVGRSGPGDLRAVEFLFLDGSHQREDTILTFRAWHDTIAPRGRIVFHDYLDPSYPGVTEAVRQLGLEGQECGRLFVWTRD
jgi:hypothetical protein